MWFLNVVIMGFMKVCLPKRMIILLCYSTVLVTVMVVGGVLSVRGWSDVVLFGLLLPVMVFLWSSVISCWRGWLAVKKKARKEKKVVKKEKDTGGDKKKTKGKKVDKKKRRFFKLISSLGLGSFFYFLFTKDAKALSFGSSSMSESVKVQDSGGSEINPATVAKQNEIIALQDNYLMKVDESGTSITYIGKAAMGSLDSDAAWQIQKVDESASPTSIGWAGSSDSYTNQWSQRASYSYN